MPKNQCKGLLNQTPGLLQGSWLTGVTTNDAGIITGFSWGSATNALCLTDDQIQAYISLLQATSNFSGGGAVVPDKGF